jgi:hypothetical protein
MHSAVQLPASNQSQKCPGKIGQSTINCLHSLHVTYISTAAVSTHLKFITQQKKNWHQMQLNLAIFQDTDKKYSKV